MADGDVAPAAPSPISGSQLFGASPNPVSGSDIFGTPSPQPAQNGDQVFGNTSPIPSWKASLPLQSADDLKVKPDSLVSKTMRIAAIPLRAATGAIVAAGDVAGIPGMKELNQKLNPDNS